MITTTPCDDRRHSECHGKGLVRGILRPDHEPLAEGREVWIEVNCECPCHLRMPHLLAARGRRIWDNPF